MKLQGDDYKQIFCGCGCSDFNYTGTNDVFVCEKCGKPIEYQEEIIDDRD